MLFRNADGGYYLIATSDTATNESAVSDESDSLAVPGTVIENGKDRSRDRLQHHEDAKVVQLKSVVSKFIDRETANSQTEAIDWISGAIFSKPDRRATKTQILKWVEKNVAGLKSNWKV